MNALKLTNKKFKLFLALFLVLILTFVLEMFGVFGQMPFLDSFSYFITLIIPLLFLFLNIDFKKNIFLSLWFIGFLILTLTTFFLILEIFEKQIFYFSLGYLIIFFFPFLFLYYKNKK